MFNDYVRLPERKLKHVVFRDTWWCPIDFPGFSAVNQAIDCYKVQVNERTPQLRVIYEL